MKSNQIIQKIALFASGIAVFALSSANAVDSEGSVGNETNIVNSDTAPANPVALCPNGQPRGTRSANCTVGQKGRQGRQGNFAKGRGGKGCNSQFAKGRGSNGRQGNFSRGRGGNGRNGQMAQQGRGGRGNSQGRKGMGPGKGLGDGNGSHDGSCVQDTAPTAAS